MITGNTNGKIGQGRKGIQCKDLKGQVSAVGTRGSVVLGACRDSGEHSFRVSHLKGQGAGISSSGSHLSLAKDCIHA